MLEGSIAFTLSVATTMKIFGFGSLTLITVSPLFSRMLEHVPSEVAPSSGSLSVYLGLQGAAQGSQGTSQTQKKPCRYV